jgi:23S rRNA (cytidine1920-2'-O)/16S rRNA (cytidine1409-2'-O)-methyltransferase
MRLDRALVERGLVASRTEGQSLIAEGHVRVDGQIARRASAPVDDGSGIEVIRPEGPAYVSRAGFKLAAALDHFQLDVQGRICLDLGASTGGFTDCLIQRGAAQVVAVDVGHGQLSASIASHSAVISREGVNARHLRRADFPDHAFSLAVADLSFISLTLILPAVADILPAGGDAVVLVKPQFEVGAGSLGKGGIVRSEALRQGAVQRVSACAQALGFRERGRIASPIAGGDGNVEYLMWLERQEEEQSPEKLDC